MAATPFTDSGERPKPQQPNDLKHRPVVAWYGMIKPDRNKELPPRPPTPGPRVRHIAEAALPGRDAGVGLHEKDEYVPLKRAEDEIPKGEEEVMIGISASDLTPKKRSNVGKWASAHARARKAAAIEPVAPLPATTYKQSRRNGASKGEVSADQLLDNIDQAISEIESYMYAFS